MPIISHILQFRKQTVLNEYITAYHRYHVNGILHIINGNNNITGGLHKVLKIIKALQTTGKGM